MPQELHVVKCYACGTFQVHIVKKVNKWSCKMCGEQQSIKKVYFRGSGKDCRLNVQALNEKQGLLKEELKETSDFLNEEQLNETDIPFQKNETKTVQSKWQEFLIPDKEPSEDEEVEDTNFTFEKLKKKNSTKKNKQLKLKNVQPDENPVSNKENGINRNEENLNFFYQLNNKKSPSPSNSQEEISQPKKKIKYSDPATNLNKNKSKWDCFLSDETQAEDEMELHQTLVSKTIFSSTDDHNLDLDDILNI